jgi:hypothetical protein
MPKPYMFAASQTYSHSRFDERFVEDIQERKKAGTVILDVLSSGFA